jgi:hypothetical protein
MVLWLRRQWAICMTISTAADLLTQKIKFVMAVLPVHTDVSSIHLICKNQKITLDMAALHERKNLLHPLSN